MSDVLDASRRTILVVDDSADNLTLMAGLLKDHYRVRLANSGEKALQLASAAQPPDLILLDIMMPGMDGYAACNQLKANARTRDIPIIFLTALSDSVDKEFGLAMGAADFITKPIDPPDLMTRVSTQLNRKTSAASAQGAAADPDAGLAQRAIQDVAILAMASLAQARSPNTVNHLRRTQHYVKLLAEQLRTDARFRAVMNDEYIDTLFRSAPLYDVGKAGIPDRILFKRGPLEAHELEILKTHCRLGREAIEQAEGWLGAKVDFFAIAKELGYSHQEKWDGSGYPEGLSGEDIPVPARLMALANAYDALTSRRASGNRQAMSHEEAELAIIDGRGRHFDPDVVDAFVVIAGQFREIAQRHADSDADLDAKAKRLNLLTGP